MGLAKELQSVQVCFSSKKRRPEDLTWNGLMWRKTICVPESHDEITYTYSFQTNKKFWVMSGEKFTDPLKRKVYSGFVQRDIISKINSLIQDTDIVNGIFAHIVEILNHSDNKSNFNELVRLKERNSTLFTHWDQAFESLLKDKLTKEKCLLFLQCIKNKIVDRSLCLCLTKSVASSIWKQLQHSDQDLNKICAMCTEDIFSIYKAANPTSTYLIHFILEGQSFLDATAVQKLVFHAPCLLCNCENSFSCLKRAFQFIFAQDADRHVLQEIIYKISNLVPENNSVDLLAIVRNTNPSDKNKELRNDFEKHILTQVETTLLEKIQNSSLLKTKEIISKAEEELRPQLVSLCEKKIIYQIKSGSIWYPESFSNDLECLCKEEIFFHRMDQKLLLLDALVNKPGTNPRSIIKYILININTADSRSSMVILDKAFEELLRTFNEDDLRETFNEFDKLSKTMSQTARTCYEKKLQSHSSKMSTSRLLLIHEDVEKLSKRTIELYCHLLKKKLTDVTFREKCKYIEISGSAINTR